MSERKFLFSCRFPLLRSRHCRIILFALVLSGSMITVSATAGPGLRAVSTASVAKSVKGRVKDAKGELLPGVSIMLKGTRNGTTSNADGTFEIAVDDPDAILIFSFIGYTTREVPVGNQSFLEITLEVSENALDEVVVVGFGTQKKLSVTGAVASIQTQEIKQSPAANLAVSLAGRLPGLTAIQRSGEPGRTDVSMFIRGMGTVNTQNPIILVDGIERDLTYVDPNEVESVTILKDASSTAIFGVRGANGVILVTTRRGATEKPEINFTAEGGLQSFMRYPKQVNSYQYATLRNLASANDGLPLPYSAEAVEHYRTGDNPEVYPNTDWRDIMIKPFAPQQRYNLNISGAGKAMKYFVNAGYLNQGGMFHVEKNLPYDPSFRLNRYSFRSNIDIQINKTLKAFLNVAGYLEKQNMPMGVIWELGGDFSANLINQSPALYLLKAIPTFNATVPGPLTPDGEVVVSTSIEDRSPWGMMNRAGYINQTRSNVTATYGMEQSLDFLTKGLSAKVVASFDNRSVNNFFARKTYAKFVQQLVKTETGRDSVYFAPFNADKNTPLAISGGRLFNSLTNVQGYLNYARDFNDHTVTGLLLYQQQQIVNLEELPYNLRGFSGRFTYAYKNTYLFEFNAGYNGSEQFAKGRRFGFFPAVSAGWVLSNEKFLARSKAVSLLKLRGSYGLVGNDRIGGRRFLYLDNIQVNGGGYIPSLGFGQTIGYNLLKNENLKWEIAKKLNIGVELGLFNSFNMIVDFFTERRDNILISRGTLPALNGLPLHVLPPLNIGKIRNRGFEIELNYRKALRKDIAVFSKLSLSHARNKQLFLDEAQLPADFAYRYRATGFKIGQNWGYVVDRYFRDEADVTASPIQNVGGHESRPGDFKYKDLNNDGVVDNKDIAPLGHSSVPEYTLGAAFSVNYKIFDLSFLFQGVSHVSGFFGDRATYALFNYFDRHTQSWTAERAAANEPITYPRLTTQANPNEISNSFFLEDRSYLRLKNAELGITLPEKWSRVIHSSRVRIYANGLNLLTWDKLSTKDFDPEIPDWTQYPITRVYNFGVNVVF